MKTEHFHEPFPAVSIGTAGCHLLGIISSLDLDNKISVSEMVRFFKGRSSKKIQEEFPQLSKRYCSTIKILKVDY
ncbi:MAG: hypothetical protein D3905_03710 [Candidatus Electrothrix sp. AS4_5]|nr:hypothetical protein [Candidatus Electrothrix gigas]